MRNALIILNCLALVILCSCAKQGEGVTLDGHGLTVGASQEARDRVVGERTAAEIALARAKAEAEIADHQKKTDASIEQTRRWGPAWRTVAIGLAIAAALTIVALSAGYGLQYAAPMAAQGVKALQVASEIRQGKRLEVTLEIGPGGYSARLRAEGYTHSELADLIHQNPALDGPRLQELQSRIGPHGMRSLARTGDLETTLALLDDLPPRGGEKQAT